MGAKSSKNNPKKLFSKQLSHKNADDFMADILQANELAGTFTDPQGYFLKFSVCSEDKILPGKLLPQIHYIYVICTRITDDGAVVKQRELTVPQFYLILTRLRDNFTSKGKLHALALANPLERSPPERSKKQLPQDQSLPSSSLERDCDGEREGECIICMSEKTDIMLPCTHPYCQACIKKWSLTSKECPICRGQFSEEKDPWIFASRPSFSEMAADVHEFAERLPVQPLEIDSNRRGVPDLENRSSSKKRRRFPLVKNRG